MKACLDINNACEGRNVGVEAIALRPGLLPGFPRISSDISEDLRPLVRAATIDDEKIVAEFWSLTPAKLRAKPPKVDLELKRRVNWPDKKALAKLVWEKPLIHAAKDIGVSDVALKKRCVKLGIELPRQGHWLTR